MASFQWLRILFCACLLCIVVHAQNLDRDDDGEQFPSDDINNVIDSLLDNHAMDTDIAPSDSNADINADDDVDADDELYTYTDIDDIQTQTETQEETAGDKNEENTAGDDIDSHSNTAVDNDDDDDDDDGEIHDDLRTLLFGAGDADVDASYADDNEAVEADGQAQGTPQGTARRLSNANLDQQDAEIADDSLQPPLDVADTVADDDGDSARGDNVPFEEAGNDERHDHATQEMFDEEHGHSQHDDGYDHRYDDDTAAQTGHMHETVDIEVDVDATQAQYADAGEPDADEDEDEHVADDVRYEDHEHEHREHEHHDHVHEHDDAHDHHGHHEHHDHGHEHDHDDAHDHDDDEYLNNYRDYDPDADEEEDDEFPADPVQPVHDEYGYGDAWQTDENETENEETMMDKFYNMCNDWMLEIKRRFAVLVEDSNADDGDDDLDYRRLYGECSLRLTRLQQKQQHPAGTASSVVDTHNSKLLKLFMFVSLDVLLCVLCHPRKSLLLKLLWTLLWSYLTFIAYATNADSPLFIVLCVNAIFPFLQPPT